MQTALDLFIDEASKRLTGRPGGYGASAPASGPAALEVPSSGADTPLMPARN